MPIKIPEILIPKNSDLHYWATIACDQFTSEPEYWQSLQELVGNRPSTLNLTFPEVYLGKDDDLRIEKINAAMQNYLSENIFGEPIKSFIITKRTLPTNKVRAGLVAALDLDEYSYNPLDKSVIRATEGTILDRLPPRVKIRKNAPLEFPHIMVLIDDKEKSVIEPLLKNCREEDKVYDFELNMGGGHITGYKANDCGAIIDAFKKLAAPETLEKKYGKLENFVFAVGDGNHSLATAKNCWDNLKLSLTDAQKQDHPARFALCEIVNLYDESLEFEPIHRLVEAIDCKKFIKEYELVEKDCCRYVCGGEFYGQTQSLDAAGLISKTDEFIKNYIAKNGGKVDYIHGEDSLRSLTQKNADSIGLIMPELKKEHLFITVAKYGALPRKTFSMGSAREKRYYLEGKKIIRE